MSKMKTFSTKNVILILKTFLTQMRTSDFFLCTIIENLQNDILVNHKFLKPIKVKIFAESEKSCVSP